MRTTLALLSLLPATLAAAEPAFKTLRLTDAFYGEGAAFGDLNNDGNVDIVSGPFIYYGEGRPNAIITTGGGLPADIVKAAVRGGGGGANDTSHIPVFTTRSELYPPVSYDPHGYSKSFVQYVSDVNGDGWNDVVEIGFPGEQTWWYANPAGKRSTLTQGTRGHWDRHLILDVTDNESPMWADITGDGKPELIAQTGGKFGYSTPDPADPTKPWTFHPISPAGDRQRFTHGLGVGDVNGDGRIDFLEKSGWWEQPESVAGDPEWAYHPVNFADNAAQMYAYDVNGDGLNDVITSLSCHSYGLAWYEQVKENGEITFKQHKLMGNRSEPSATGVVFSQLHAIDLVDMDGDGLKDIVTGKRFWAHGPNGDDEPDAPPVVYYFKLVRDGSEARYEPVLVHDASGVGTQVLAGDVNADGKPDVVVGNKLGTFVSIRK